MNDAQKLTLQDLSAVVNLIDVFSKRGALEGSELFAVGFLREKIVNHIKEHEVLSEPVEQKEE